MDDEEIERFLEYADNHNFSGGKEASMRRIVEELSEENQKLFWEGMRVIIPAQVAQFRDAESDQQSISA